MAQLVDGRRPSGSWPQRARAILFPGSLACERSVDCGSVPGAPPHRLLVQWHLTERCNLRCAHCYQEATARAELGPDELPGVLEQCAALIASLGDGRTPPRARGHVTLTGGEPLVHAGFWDLAERIAAARPALTFAVLTNGTLVDRDAARRLRSLGAGFVQVSIDGAETTHDRIRGAGSHARAVAGLRHLVREGVRTMISFTASRTNWSEFPRVAGLGRRLGVNRVWADRMVPCGGAATLRDEVLTPEETRRFIGVMRDAQRRYASRRTEIALHRALQFTLGGGTPYRCSAGDSLITIMPDGDVHPCRRMPRRVGNVRSMPLAEIYRSSPLLVALRDRRRAIRGCEACFYADVCGGGLRCLAAAVHGDPFRADPGCWLSGAVNDLDDAVGGRAGGDTTTARPDVLLEEVAWKS